MLGVFEINPEHEFYHLTSMMKDGMRGLIQVTTDTPEQVNIPFVFSLSDFLEKHLLPQTYLDWSETVHCLVGLYCKHEIL